MKYKIWCEVYGGVTGHRFGWLKRMDREIIYDSKEDAERVAKSLNDKPKYSKAVFSYEVVGFKS